MNKIKESLRLELDDLSCKIAKLALFKVSSDFYNLDEASQFLIETQLEVMKIYEFTLQKRIDNLK